MTKDQKTLYIYYANYIRILLIITISLFFCNEADANQILTISKTKITLSLSREPMRDVVAQIYQQSGYHVTIDEKWYDIPCSGRFENVSVEQIMGRLLQRFNVYSIIDEKDKKINYIIHRDDESLSLLPGVTPFKSVGSMAGISLGVVSFPIITQVKGPQFHENKADQIDTLSGIPFIELSSQHQRQIADRKLRESDPDSIDPLTGISSVQLAWLFTEQIKDRIQRDEKLDYLDPMAGLTRRELKYLHARQKEDRLNRSHDLNDLEPFSGLTYHELAALQNKQVKERHLRESQNLIVR